MTMSTSDQQPDPAQPVPPGNQGTRRAAKIAVGGLAALMLAGAATGIGAGLNRAEAAGLATFDDCQAVDDWYTAALLPQVTAWGLPYGYGYGYGLALAAAGTMPSMAREDVSTPVGNGGTGTNLQERDVDEPDTAKTANGVLVTTVGTRLVVFDVSGASPVELGSVAIDSLVQQSGAELGLWGTGGSTPLLLDGDRVVVFGSRGQPLDESGQGGSMTPWLVTTTVTLVDISDRSAPAVLSTTEIEGTLLDARQHDGAVRVVTTSTPMLTFPVPADDFVDGQGNPEAAEEAKAVEANKAALQALTGEDFLPRSVTRDAAGKITRLSPAMSCSALAHPAEFAGAGVATITTLRPADAQAGADPAVDRIGVASDGQTVYSSADRLYVATTPGGFGWARAMSMPFPGPGLLPAGPPEAATTDVHAFDVTSPDTTTYRASGSVDGTIIGSWALSERDGYLRVATTRDHADQEGSAEIRSDAGVAVSGPAPASAPAWAAEEPAPAVVPGNAGSDAGGGNSAGGVAPPAAPAAEDTVPEVVVPPAEPTAPPATDDQGRPLDEAPVDDLPPGAVVSEPQPPVPNTDSAITILRENGDQLTAVGSVEGLGQGETIQAVRWFDTTAYVVTFRRTDPLYVVDLSDPAAPAVTGELKVPGFSAYLHPVGDDVLLGIGSSATGAGQVTGLQVSTFDVADPAAPHQLSVLSREHTYSDVSYDSTVFSYLPDQRLAVLPVNDDQGTMVLGVRVDTDATLSEAGTFRATERPGWSPLKVMPVGDGALVVIAQASEGVVVTMLDPSMQATGALTINW